MGVAKAMVLVPMLRACPGAVQVLLFLTIAVIGVHVVAIVAWSTKSCMLSDCVGGTCACSVVVVGQYPLLPSLLDRAL